MPIVSSQLHNKSTLDLNISLNTSSMATSSSLTVISSRALTELMELSGESKLHVMIHEMEAMDDRLAIFDSLDCLRDTVRRENDKLAYLTQLLDQVKDGIREKEGHMDIMDLCD
ncbi:hypothetical protein Tco_1435006 [Tanacetum coccineum]